MKEDSVFSLQHGEGPCIFLQNQSCVSSWCDGSGVREFPGSHRRPHRGEEEFPKAPQGAQGWNL